MRLVLLSVWFVTLLAMGGYAYLHSVQIKDNELDQFTQPLMPMRHFLVPHARLALVDSVKPIEHLLWIRYAFFPLEIYRMQDHAADSVLHICNSSDTEHIKRMRAEAAVIWQSEQNGFIYSLAVYGKK